MSMRLLRLFGGREATAPVARERLQILLSHERGLLGQSDLLLTLREEILAVVSKHIVLDPDKVIVKLDRGKTVSTLEVDIEVPNNFDKSKASDERRMAG
jgi:cell division topological specificity factor